MKKEEFYIPIPFNYERSIEGRFTDQPELFSILFNKSFITEEEIKKLREVIDYQVREMVHEFINRDLHFSISRDEEMVMYIDDAQHYVASFLHCAKSFNPFKRISDREVNMILLILKENKILLRLPESIRKDILSLIHFAIGNVVDEGGGYLLW